MYAEALNKVTWSSLRIPAAIVALSLLASLAASIALPGVSASQAEAFQGAAANRLSIFALDVNPLITFALLIQLFSLLSDAFRRSLADVQIRASIAKWALAAALATAAFQAYGIAGALEGVADLVEQPGLLFRVSTMLTLVASTAMAAWLIERLARYGYGDGLLALYALPVLTAVPDAVLGLPQNGEVDISLIVLCLLGSFAAAVVLLTLLDRSGLYRGGLAASKFTWVLPLAYLALGWVFAAVMFADASAARGMLQSPLTRLSILGALTLAFSLLTARAANDGITPPRPLWLRGLLPGLVLAGLAIGSEWMAELYPLYIHAPHVAILIMLALALLAQLQEERAP